METETIASRNAVDLLLNEAFETGICGLGTPEKKKYVPQQATSTHDDFVLGWDC